MAATPVASQGIITIPNTFRDELCICHSSNGTETPRMKEAYENGHWMQ